MITPYTEKNAFFVSLFLSKITSRVPVTLVLYLFAQPTESLLIGVNLGGPGTLVASMVSVISYRFMMRETSVSAGSYLKKFTF